MMKYFPLTACLLAFSTMSMAENQFDNLTLEQAVQIALHNHRSLQVSAANLEIAEARYQQAMASFQPNLNLEAGFQRNNQDRTFTFNGAVQTPAMALPLGPGGALVSIPGQPLPINMDVKMFDRDVTKASLTLSYPLYTGGKQQAVEDMADKGVLIARVEKHKSELDVVHDIKKYYHGAQFARQMAQMTSETLERFEVLSELTERFYQSDSLKVKKTDYLRAKTTTEVTRAMLHEANYASTLTRDALINAMGLPLNSTLNLASEPPLPAFDATLDHLLQDAMTFNPDKQRLELAVQIADDKINEANSGYLPEAGLEATSYQYWNSYNSGLFNNDNRSGWVIGVGVKWKLFDAGLTRAGVSAAHAGKMRLEAQKVLLDNGLALQIKDDFLRIQRSRAEVDDNIHALGYAEENRKLQVRAYQEEMVETKEVIEAQLIESYANASLFRARHDLQIALSDLDYQVGEALH